MQLVVSGLCFGFGVLTENAFNPLCRSMTRGNKSVPYAVQTFVFEQASLGEPRNALSDWILRGAIALLFVLEGADKFGPASGWIKLFQQIGIGQWFRYFTGVVEILGGVLVLIPWTVTAGLALLACTMASAALILAFVVGRPEDSVFSGAFLIGLVAFWWNRRDASGTV